MVEDTNSEKKVVDMVDSNSFFFEVTSKNGAILSGPPLTSVLQTTVLHFATRAKLYLIKCQTSLAFLLVTNLLIL